MGPRACLNIMEKRKSLPLPGIKPQFLMPPAGHCADCTVPTTRVSCTFNEVRWLFFFYVFIFSLVLGGIFV